MWELIILLKMFLHNKDHNLEPTDCEIKSKWIEISSTFMSIFSHKLAISLINVILVARNAFDAYFINSAALLEVWTYFAPFTIKGEYLYTVDSDNLKTFDIKERKMIVL